MPQNNPEMNPMPQNFHPRLRGNVFLLFLLRCAKNELGVAPSWGSSTNGLTRPELFMCLMRTVEPTYKPVNDITLRQYLSQYLNGTRPNSPEYYPFKDPAFRYGAETRLKTDWSGALAVMDTLCRTYLKADDTYAVTLLVGGLVDLILADVTVPDHTCFHTGCREVSKTELDREKKFILQPFLLSVWGYIVLSHPDAAEGAETYLAWTEDAGGGNPRHITTLWGSERAKIISVSVTLPETRAATDTAEKEEPSQESHEAADLSPDPHEEASSPDFQEEAGGEQAPQADENPASRQTLISNGRIYNQHAEKIINIEHVATLNI